MQVQHVTEALVEYIKIDLIPKHPAACHELGTYVYPHLQLEGACTPLKALACPVTLFARRGFEGSQLSTCHCYNCEHSSGQMQHS